MALSGKQVIEDLGVAELQKLIKARRLSEDLPAMRGQRAKLIEELRILDRRIVRQEREVQKLCRFHRAKPGPKPGRRRNDALTIAELTRRAHVSADPDVKGLKAGAVVGWVCKHYAATAAAKNGQLGLRVGWVHTRSGQYRRLGRGLYARKPEPKQE